MIVKNSFQLKIKLWTTIETVTTLLRRSITNMTVRNQSAHKVPCGKFHSIGGAPPETFPNVKYDALEEVCGYRKCFDSPIKK